MPIPAISADEFKVQAFKPLQPQTARSRIEAIFQTKVGKVEAADKSFAERTVNFTNNLLDLTCRTIQGADLGDDLSQIQALFGKDICDVATKRFDAITEGHLNLISARVPYLLADALITTWKGHESLRPDVKKHAAKLLGGGRMTAQLFLETAADLAKVPECREVLAIVFDELATADAGTGRHDPKYTLDFLAARKELVGPSAIFDSLATVADSKMHFDHMLSWKDDQGKVMCAAAMARRLMANPEEPLAPHLERLIRSMSEECKNLWAQQEESSAVKEFIKNNYARAWGAVE